MLLFGGEVGWDATDWTSSDDTVRGGKSKSHLRIHGNRATFEGNLDTETLGGAGFCSQRTTRDDRTWDLSSYNGIEILCDTSIDDGKVYTFILKDQILPPSDNGREQSTISWEYDFKVSDAELMNQETKLGRLCINWNQFKATYRGRPKLNADPLSLNKIKRMSIMMRSFFATQSGDFRLDIVSIRAIDSESKSACLAEPDQDSSIFSLDKNEQSPPAEAKQGLFSRFFCCCSL